MAGWLFESRALSQLAGEAAKHFGWIWRDLLRDPCYAGKRIGGGLDKDTPE